MAPGFRGGVRVLLAGGVIAYPTEAVYGFGCLPDRPDAIDRIVQIKGRSPSAGFILIGGNIAQFAGWIAPTAAELERLHACHDTPITWVVTAGPIASPAVTGGRKTIAIRLTSHPVARNLCTAAGGPIISTSANRHGRPPARTALGVRSRFRQTVDAVVGGAVGPLARPTEIRVAASGMVLRRG